MCLPETVCCQFGTIYSCTKVFSKLEPRVAQAVVDSSSERPGVFQAMGHAGQTRHLIIKATRILGRESRRDTRLPHRDANLAETEGARNLVVRSSSLLTNSSWQRLKPQEDKIDPTVGLFHRHLCPGEENPVEGCGGHREVSTGHKGV